MTGFEIMIFKFQLGLIPIQFCIAYSTVSMYCLYVTKFRSFHTKFTPTIKVY